LEQFLDQVLKWIFRGLQPRVDRVEDEWIGKINLPGLFRGRGQFIFRQSVLNKGRIL
jgi:hypothetical protein